MIAPEPGLFHVVSVSAPYPDRGASELVRVYLDVRLDDPPLAPRRRGAVSLGQPRRAVARAGSGEARRIQAELRGEEVPETVPSGRRAS